MPFSRALFRIGVQALVAAATLSCASQPARLGEDVSVLVTGGIVVTMDGGLVDKVGSLEVGQRADLIIVSTDRPRHTPMYDPISHLVYVTHGDDVQSVIINGLRGGRGAPSGATRWR